MSNVMRLYTPLKDYCDPFKCTKPGKQQNYPDNVTPVKNKTIKENFGSFSLYGSVRPSCGPCNTSRGNPGYKQPQVMGVN